MDVTASQGYYLEDLQVGQRFETATHTITEEQIRAFAGQYDPQPFHLDAEAARATMFGGLAASGWHTAAITMRLLVDERLFASGMIGAGCELAWPRPTRPGDVLRVVSEVLEIQPSNSRPDRGIALMRSETLNQAGEVVQRLTSRMVVFRRPRSDAGTA